MHNKRFKLEGNMMTFKKREMNANNYVSNFFERL